jgi:AcrR family transcriptional regulator
MGRKSKADIRKQEILASFYEVLKEEGIEHASIAKIASKMQVNPSLLIHYFKTKEEMVVEVVDYLLQRYEDAFLEEVNRLEEPKERFELVLNLLFGVSWVEVIDYSVFYGCYYLSARHERIKERFQEMYLHFKEYLTKEVEIWLEHQLISPQPAEQVAEFLITNLEGLAYYGHIFQDKASYAQRASFVKTMILKCLSQ